MTVSGLWHSVISDRVTGQICEEPFLLGSWKYICSFTVVKKYMLDLLDRLIDGYLPGHHAEYRAHSISGDNSLAVRESIKALLEDPDLALVQTVQRLWC